MHPEHLGRIPAGNAYGYDMVVRTTGERQINEAESAVVRRIFKAYAAGHSPRAIAKKLNAEGIPGPGGGKWGDTSIRGHPTREPAS